MICVQATGRIDPTGISRVTRALRTRNRDLPARTRLSTIEQRKQLIRATDVNCGHGLLRAGDIAAGSSSGCSRAGDSAGRRSSGRSRAGNGAARGSSGRSRAGDGTARRHSSAGRDSRGRRDSSGRRSASNHGKKNIGRLNRDGEMLPAVNRQAIHRRKCSGLRSEIHDFERAANSGHKAVG